MAVIQEALLLHALIRFFGFDRPARPDLFTGALAQKYPPPPRAGTAGRPLRQMPPTPTFALSCTWIAKALDGNSLRPSSDKIRAAKIKLGGIVYQYLRAIYFAGGRIPMMGNTGLANKRMCAAFERDLRERAVTDINTWERGREELTKIQVRAHRLARRAPPDLIIPSEVRIALAALAEERAKRAAERGRRGQAGAPARPAGTPGQVPGQGTTGVMEAIAE
ncbi:hypothetical protein ACFOYU_11780 [Microvirga sp. GCM10011540]|uniref:hypothetical protein n=1 Tax=Microvirga sp. GCM10011540 TaxID=3317338 RepID=UPI00360E5115